MDEQTQETAPSLSHSQFLRIALAALATKAARWLTMLMSFTLFGAAVWWPDWKRLAASAVFTAFVFLPLWFKKEPR